VNGKFCLRHIHKYAEADRSDSYVHGIMDGEIMKAAEAGEYEFQDVIIV
jgi:hypothetical protein